MKIVIIIVVVISISLWEEIIRLTLITSWSIGLIFVSINILGRCRFAYTLRGPHYNTWFCTSLWRPDNSSICVVTVFFFIPVTHASIIIVVFRMLLLLRGPNDRLRSFLFIKIPIILLEVIFLQVPLNISFIGWSLLILKVLLHLVIIVFHFKLIENKLILKVIRGLLAVLLLLALEILWFNSSLWHVFERGFRVLGELCRWFQIL